MAQKPDLTWVGFKLPKELDTRIELAVAHGLDKNKSALAAKAIDKYLQELAA